MAKKINKEDLKSPDAFITFSDKAAKLIEKNKVSVFSTIGLVLLVVLGFSAQKLIQKSSEKSGQEALFTLEQMIEKNNADNKELKEFNKDVFSKKYPNLLSEYENLMSSHSKTSAAYLASVSMAQLLVDYKWPEKAVEILNSAIKKADQGSVFYGLLNMQLSKVLLDSEKVEDALATLNSISESKSLTFLHATALLRKGVVFEKLNKPDQAKESYNRVLNEHAKSQSASMAKTYLRLLSLGGDK